MRTTSARRGKGSALVTDNREVRISSPLFGKLEYRSFILPVVAHLTDLLLLIESKGHRALLPPWR